MSLRENVLKAARFETPEYIPVFFHVNPACWNHYDQEMLKGLMEEHTFLFPGYERPPGRVEPSYAPNQRKGVPYTDPWGCVWETTEDGITGSVHRHPLARWEDFEHYRPPDPDLTDGTFPVDWKKIHLNMKSLKERGIPARGGLPHGHTFLRLTYIRGYENLVFDMADEEPRLFRLIEMVEEFNHRCVMKWTEAEPDIMCYPDDLGMQQGPMVSPECFRKFIKPVYTRIMKPAREHGCLVHMHSDGDIRLLAEDLIDAGVDILNLQDLVNGIDWIAEHLAGRICIDLDIDRQRITRFGTPAEIDRLVREEVEKLGERRGGLMLTYGLYPGVPPENVKALMDALERYAFFYS